MQIISKKGVVKCVNRSSTPYPPEIIKQMKAAGYTVKEVSNEGRKG